MLNIRGRRLLTIVTTAVALGASGAAAQVVAGWLESPRHCANLMDADYVDMGVAYAVESQSAAGVYWAQVFAAPASRS